MIRSVTVQNYVGDILTMDLFRPQDSGFIITNITGLGPAQASINMTDYATLDGSSFNSSRVQYRNIVMRLRLLGSPSIEVTRYQAYRYFPVKRQVTIVVETDTRLAQISGYVESCEPDIFSQEEEIEISILCPDPVWYSLGQSIMRFSGIEPRFEFPFSNEGNSPELVMSEIVSDPVRVLDYAGDYDVGAEFHFRAYATVGAITMYHIETAQQMTINPANASSITGGTFLDEDEIIVVTKRGHKSAQLLRNGHYYNIMNTIDRASKWMQIQVGRNTMSYSLSSGDIQDVSLEIYYNESYQGV